MDLIKTKEISFPKLGLGTFRMTDEICTPAVISALELGYRHIDTAEMYGNERGVGEAIVNSGVARKDLHITTKVWHDNLAPDAIRRSFDASLSKLKLDYVDLYLIHWPSPTMNLPVILETLTRFKEEGRLRAIGVANFTIPLLRKVVEEIRVPISCNQVEYHVFLDQSHLLQYMRLHSIPLVAYCPLAQGKVAESPELDAIGAKHGVTGSQVALKWLLDQEGVAAIPKAQRIVSQQANLDSLKVELDDEDRATIAGLQGNRRLVNPGFAPQWDE